MRGSLQKLALLLVILALIKLPFAYFYQSELDVAKTEFASREFNTVFIGSSRTRQAIIPGEFDRQTNQIAQSYNFGTSGGLPPRTFDLCEDLIATHPSIKYVFFELSGGIDRAPEYDVSLSGFSFSEYYRALTMLPFDASLIYHNKLVLALLKPDLSGNYISYNWPTAPAFEKQQRQVGSKVSDDNLRLSHLLNRQMETTDVVPTATANPAYLRGINRLIELAESKQVRIYFYIPPRIETEEEFKTVYAVYQRLEPKNRLVIAHDDASLYRADTSYDDFHLNYAGAMLFTEHFAMAFNDLNR